MSVPMLAQGYARTYRANAVLTASPGQLVLMLFDGALACVGRAREALERPVKDARGIEVINTQLLKAQAILTELQNGLNHEAGGEIAANLDRLYIYYNRRLFEANLRKEVAPVIEVERLLGDLRSGWAEMLAQQSAPATVESATRSVA